MSDAKITLEDDVVVERADILRRVSFFGTDKGLHEGSPIFRSSFHSTMVEKINAAGSVFGWEKMGDDEISQILVGLLDSYKSNQPLDKAQTIAKNALVEYGGMTEEEAEAKVRGN